MAYTPCSRFSKNQVSPSMLVYYVLFTSYIISPPALHIQLIIHISLPLFIRDTCSSICGLPPRGIVGIVTCRCTGQLCGVTCFTGEFLHYVASMALPNQNPRLLCFSSLQVSSLPTSYLYILLIGPCRENIEATKCDRQIHPMTQESNKYCLPRQASSFQKYCIANGNSVGDRWQLSVDFCLPQIPLGTSLYDENTYTFFTLRFNKEYYNH